MGNAESKAAAKLEVVLPRACNYLRRRDLIKNTILLLKTDTNLSRLLGFEGDQTSDSRPKTWSFEYLVAASAASDTNSNTNSPSTEPASGSTSRTPRARRSRCWSACSTPGSSSADAKQYTVTLALLVDNVFRWKVDAVVTSAERGNEIAFQAKAAEALGEVVDGLLAERLRGVYHFVRGGERYDGDASTEMASTMVATPLSSAPGSPVGELPRYEDVKR
ncbi:hypothetical protein MBLNU457_g0404t1 [Dothideomycetes sp. NU457]